MFRTGKKFLEKKNIRQRKKRMKREEQRPHGKKK
jgi:hypothetical protein